MIYCIIFTVLIHVIKGGCETEADPSLCDDLRTKLATLKTYTELGIGDGETVECVMDNCAVTCASQTDTDWCINVESYLTCQAFEISGVSSKFCAPSDIDPCGCTDVLQGLIDTSIIANTRTAQCSEEGHCVFDCDSAADDCALIADALMAAGLEGTGLTLSCISDGVCSPPGDSESCTTDAKCAAGTGNRVYDMIVDGGNVAVCYVELGECTISCADQSVCDNALQQAQNEGELEGQAFTCTTTPNGDLCVLGEGTNPCSGDGADSCSDGSDLNDVSVCPCIQSFLSSGSAPGSASLVCADTHCTMSCGTDDDCNRLAAGLGISDTLNCVSYGDSSQMICSPESSGSSGSSGSSDECVVGSSDADLVAACSHIASFITEKSITGEVIVCIEGNCGITCTSNTQDTCAVASTVSSEALVCLTSVTPAVCVPDGSGSSGSSGSSGGDGGGDSCTSSDVSDTTVCPSIRTFLSSVSAPEGAALVCADTHCTMSCTIDDDCNRLAAGLGTSDTLTCQSYGDQMICSPEDTSNGCSTVADCSYITVPSSETVRCDVESGECILSCSISTTDCTTVSSDFICLEGECQEEPQCTISPEVFNCITNDEIFAAAASAAAVSEGVDHDAVVLCIDGDCEISCGAKGDDTCKAALGAALETAQAANEADAILELLASTIVCDTETNTCDIRDAVCDPLNQVVDGCVCTPEIEDICMEMQSEINSLTFKCDPDINRCTVVCESNDICTTAAGVIGGTLECVPLSSESSINVCRESSSDTGTDEPTTTGATEAGATEEGTTGATEEDTNCETYQYPKWNSHPECLDEEGDGCALRLEVGFTVCNINGDIELGKITANIKKAIKKVLDTLEDKTVTCELDMIRLTELTSTTLLDDPNEADTRGTNRPQTEDECPDLDALCGAANDNPGYRLHAKISLVCGSCAELRILLVNMAGIIQSGAIDTEFAATLLVESEADDALCGRGLGNVDISTTLSVKLMDADGNVLEEGVIVVDLGGSKASQRGFYVGILVMVAVFTFFS